MESNKLIPLEHVLEIEGLVMLINERGESTPKEIVPLLEQKIETLLNNVKQLSLGTKTDDCIDMIEASVETDDNKESSVQSLNAIAQTTLDEEQTEASDDDNTAIAQSTLDEESEDADIDKLNIESTSAGEQLEPTTEAEDIIDEDEDAVAGSTDDEPEEAEASDNIPVEEHVFTTPQKAKKQIKIPLNDRYIFRRELFNFSDEEMQEALQVVEEMSSVEELEDYFYNDLCWDPDNEVVKDFMSIITSQF